MRALFFRADAPDQVVGEARWEAGRTIVHAEDEAVRAALGRVFRPTSVAVDDPVLRTAGTAGPAVLPPGSMTWFQSAARARSADEGLTVRLVAEASAAMGWDPAGAYRPFNEAIARRERLAGVASPSL